MRQVYKWCENVFIVEGYLRSCVYDLQRSAYELVPKESAALRAKIEGKTPEEAAGVCTEVELEWVDFFTEHEYVLLVPELLSTQFPAVAPVFEVPAEISNAIVHGANDLPKVLKLLDALGCRHLHLLVETDVQLEWILEVHFKTTNFLSVSATIDTLVCGTEVLERISENYLLVSDLVVKSGLEEPCRFNDVPVFQYQNDLPEMPLFIVKYQTFFESGVHHLYFNRKLFVAADGTIRNAPHCEEAAGNMRDVVSEADLLELLRSPQLTAQWNSRKDRVVVCSDCEFRRMCFEKNRLLPLKNGLYQLERECAYNPYIAKWKGDPDYRSLTDSGIGIEAEEQQVDHAKLGMLIAELWEV